MDDRETHVRSVGAYAELKAHAAGCEACLGDLVLTLASYRLVGDLNFEPVLCPVGEALMLGLSKACVLDDFDVRTGSIWPNSN